VTDSLYLLRASALLTHVKTERPTKLKIGRMEAHETGNSLIYFQVKRSRLQGQSVKASLLLLAMYTYICGGRILEQSRCSSVADPLDSLSHTVRRSRDGVAGDSYAQYATQVWALITIFLKSAC